MCVVSRVPVQAPSPDIRRQMLFLHQIRRAGTHILEGLDQDRRTLPFGPGCTGKVYGISTRVRFHTNVLARNQFRGVRRSLGTCARCQRNCNWALQRARSSGSARPGGRMRIHGGGDVLLYFHERLEKAGRPLEPRQDL